MSIAGFQAEDFNVFQVEGLDERMHALIEHIRPKLEYLGEHLVPKLSSLTGEEMFYHVAKHARRTVNPPDDTWVAWAHNKRGYKQHPHFQVGLWGTHLFVWFALIYESPTKADFARQIRPEIQSVLQSIPRDYVWSMDHTQPEVIPHQGLDQKKLSQMMDRLENVKKSEILCGIQIKRDDPILEDGQALIEKILETFQTLTPLYKIARSD